jgi:hypothetical protein
MHRTQKEKSQKIRRDKDKEISLSSAMWVRQQQALKAEIESIPLAVHSKTTSYVVAAGQQILGETAVILTQG